MASRNKYYIDLLCLYIFINVASHISANGEASYKFIPDEWEPVENSWPQSDVNDLLSGKQTQFYHNEKTDEPKGMTLKIKNQIIDEFKDNLDYYKVSFKLWFSDEENGSNIKVEDGTSIHDISKEHNDNYNLQWMPCEYALNYNNLKNFKVKISYSSAKAVIAFKDFKIEYEILNQIEQNQNHEVSLLNNWNSYLEPNKENPLGEDFEYFFFTNNCNDFCELKSSDIWIPKHVAKTKYNVTIQFEYFIIGTKETIIKLNNGDEFKNNGEKWTSEEISLVDTDYKNISIKITTGKITFAEKQLVAIRKLIVKVSNENSKFVVECLNPQQCKWSGLKESFWSKTSDLIDKNKLHFYPTSVNNSLTIIKNESIVDKNVCFNIGYRASTKIIQTLKVYYRNLKESNSNLILTIQPKSNGRREFEDIQFCLRDLIVLSVEEYSISFVLEQGEIVKGPNDFLLRINENSDSKKPWIFEDDSQNFLHNMQVQESDAKINEEWFQLIPNAEVFKIDEKSVTFSANTATRIPASAILLTKKWIKNDKNLHKIKSRYSIIYTDMNQKSNFKITPQICDSLFHCYDVFKEKEVIDIAHKKQTIVFDFLHLDYSSYIKIQFYVEYFKTMSDIDDENDLKLEFQLILEHFGDPCSNQSICEKDNECSSNPKIDIPNNPNCDNIDSCNLPKSQLNGKPSGGKYCSKLELECEALNATSYKCVCDKKDAINWNQKDNICEQPIINANNWTSDPSDSFNWIDDKFSPIDINNSLDFVFKEISNTKNVCFRMTYESKVKYNLIISYSTTKETYKLFTFPLNIGYSEKLNFCIRDFLYDFASDFQLSFVVEGDKNCNCYNETYFSSTFNISVEDIKIRSFPVIRNTDYPEKDKQIPMWKFTSSLLKQNTTPFSINLKDTASKDSKSVFIMSDWIKSTSNYDSDQNYFALEFKNGSEFTKIKQYIVIYNSSKLIEIKPGNPTPLSSNLYRINDMKNVGNIFKIIFEISYSLTADAKGVNNIDLNFQSLTIGDPCNKMNFQTFKPSPTCQNNRTCHAVDFNDYKCDCDDKQEAGKNCQFVNLCNKKEAKIYCKQFPSLPNEQNCESVDNDNFRCKCYDNYIWREDLKKCVTKEKIRKNKICMSKNCEFLDNLVKGMIWNSKNLPTFTKDPDDKLYRPKNITSQLKINISSLNKTSDLCLSLPYILSDNAKIGLNINNINFLNLTTHNPSPDQYSNSYKFESDYFCVRHAFGKINENFTISLYPIIEDTNDFSMIFGDLKSNELISIDYKYNDYEKKIGQLSYLTLWKSIKTLEVDKDIQWPIRRPFKRLPQSYWSLDGNNSIKFEVKSETKKYREAAIISQLLNKDLSGRELKFQMTKLPEDHDEYKNFILRIIFLNESMQEIERSNFVIGDDDLNNNALDNKTIIYKIPQIKSTFRIAISLNYITYKDQSVHVILNNINLGDPCIKDHFDYQSCNGKGECNRIKDSKDYTCACNTSEHFKGKDCDIYDACGFPFNVTVNPKIGKDFCHESYESGCENNKNNKLGFDCICNNKTYWVYDNDHPTNSGCRLEPKCLTHNLCDEVTRSCHESDSVDGNPECLCNEKNLYFNTSKSPDKCLKFNPCNEEMRIQMKLTDPLCEDKNAKCVTLGEGINDYICVCPDGFRNSEFVGNLRKSSCILKSDCYFPSLNNCSQYCIPNNENGKNYTCKCNDGTVESFENPCNSKSCNDIKCLNGTFCDNGECVCKPGYTQLKSNNGSVIGCKPDITYQPALDFCPYNKLIITKDYKLGCECGTKYKMNNKYTCDLISLCGKDGDVKRVCDEKNALCLTYTKDGEINYKCECPVGQEFISENNITEYRCVNKCQAQNREINCINMNAVCDPIRITKKDIAASEYCICNAGFVKKNNTCKLASFALELSFSIKNAFEAKINESTINGVIELNLTKSSGADLLKLIEDYKYTNEINQKLNEKANIDLKNYKIERILTETIIKIYSKITKEQKYKERINNLRLKSWNLTSDFYECKLIITSTDEEAHKYFKTLNTKLGEKENCRLLSGSSNLCFVEVANGYYDTGEPYVLDKNKLKQDPIDYKPCDSSNNKQKCPEFSYCKPEEGSSKYSCTCDLDYFTVSNQESIELESESKPDGKYKKQYCIVKDKCNECPSKNGHCIQPLPIFDKTTNKWKADPVCLCEKDYYLTSDNKTKQCTGVCGDHKCAHGECKSKGESYACVCSEGWNGDFCDKEYKTGMGGWIAGIVILAVLVVVAAGVAMIFARRARNNNYGNNSGHQLDDYTGSSYRVGQSGPAAARGQPAYQGRDNQSFHRD